MFYGPEISDANVSNTSEFPHSGQNLSSCVTPFPQFEQKLAAILTVRFSVMQEATVGLTIPLLFSTIHALRTESGLVTVCAA